jgi:hypothetical protein
MMLPTRVVSPLDVGLLFADYIITLGQGAPSGPVVKDLITHFQCHTSTVTKTNALMGADEDIPASL